MPLEHRFSACACYLVAAGNHHTGLYSQPQWSKTAIFPHVPNQVGACDKTTTSVPTLSTYSAPVLPDLLSNSRSKLQVTAIVVGSPRCRCSFTKGSFVPTTLRYRNWLYPAIAKASKSAGSCPSFRHPTPL